MSISENFKTFVDCIRLFKLDTAKVDNRIFSGFLRDRSLDSSVVDKIKLIENNKYDVIINTDGLISFCLPAFFYFTLDDLLCQSKYKHEFPEHNFYIVDIDYCFDGINFADYTLVYKYKCATQIYGILKAKCDHVDFSTVAEKLIFLDKTKLVVNDSYSSKDLVSIENIDDFCNYFLENDKHSPQKIQILKKSLIKFYELESCINFSQLLKDFNKLFDYFNKEYQAYMSDVSYDKYKNEIEDRLLSYFLSVNKTVSDLQAQLIAIPATVIVAATQMKVSDGNNNYYLNNLVVAISCCFFILAVFFLVFNQRNSLLFLKSEITSYQLKIKNNYVFLKNDIEINEKLSILRSRICVQKIILYVVFFSLVCAFFVTILMFLSNTFKSYNLLFSKIVFNFF